MAILVMVLLVVTAIGVGGITYMFANEGCKEKISKLEAELGEKDKKNYIIRGNLESQRALVR